MEQFLVRNHLFVFVPSWQIFATKAQRHKGSLDDTVRLCAFSAFSAVKCNEPQKVQSIAEFRKGDLEIKELSFVVQN
jgi:hypothetical protein